MILIFKDESGNRIATPNWTVEEIKEAEGINISYVISRNDSVMEEPYYIKVSLKITMDQLIRIMHWSKDTNGICNISNVEIIPS
jgi:hypothetical protein